MFLFASAVSLKDVLFFLGRFNGCDNKALQVCTFLYFDHCLKKVRTQFQIFHSSGNIYIDSCVPMNSGSLVCLTGLIRFNGIISLG
jgi:hypothetical protein